MLRLPPGSVQVKDADEEIFLLYTRLAAKAAPDGSSMFTGLGSVNSKADILTVALKLPLAEERELEVTRSCEPSLDFSTLTSSVPAKRRRRQHGKSPRKRGSERNSDGEQIEVQLLQDKTSLRSKRGDTGSVLWRVSVELGQLLLRQFCSAPETSLIDLELLAQSHVLELGAGTGMLGIVLSPWAKHYTITDLDYLVPLIRKNVVANQEITQEITRRARACHELTNTQDDKTSIIGKIDIESLDWLSLHHAISTTRKPAWPLQAADPIDVVLAVDCIYNPSLIPAFLDTLDFFASARTAKAEGSEGRECDMDPPLNHRPCVLVVAELRSEDVMREFLEQWLARDGWEIWRVDWDSSDDNAGNGVTELSVEPGLDVCFVIWAGWKSEDHR